MDIDEKRQFELDLSRFNGSDCLYELHYFNNLFLLYTDGAKYLADKARCHWLLSLILQWQIKPEVIAEHFQVWKLQKIENQWILICRDGNKNFVAAQVIVASDFPLDEITLWYTDSVLMLPNEY